MGKKSLLCSLGNQELSVGFIVIHPDREKVSTSAGKAAGLKIAVFLELPYYQTRTSAKTLDYIQWQHFFSLYVIGLHGAAWERSGKHGKQTMEKV